jgi:murein DD-endopeptidase MepM/ murein hydrolase activator NlpD
VILANAIVHALFGGSFSWVRGYIGGTEASGGHSGIDLAAPTGTPVRALQSGVVNTAGWSNLGGGNVVWIDVNSRYRQDYAHLNTVLVKPGQYVTAGTVIGTVGSTGNATGPHLHFGVWDRSVGNWIDPVPSLLSLAGPLYTGGGTPTYAMTCSGSVGFCLPTNKVLTTTDIHAFVDQLIKVFPQYKNPVSGAAAQAATLNVLMPFVGQQWNDATIKKISLALLNATSNGGQDAVLGVAGQAIGNAVAAVIDIPGKVLAGVGAFLSYAAAVVFIIVGIWLYAKGTSQPVEVAG